MMTELQIRRLWSMGHRTFLAAGILLGGLSAGEARAGSHQLTVEDNRLIAVASEQIVYIKNPRGKTIVFGRADMESVSIRAMKSVHAKDEDAAREWMDELKYEVVSDGRQISITAEHPRRLGFDGSIWAFIRGIRYKAQINFTVEVPRRFDVKVSSSSGDVRVATLDGNVAVYGSSGDIFVKGIGGDAMVEASSGDAEVVDVKGDIRLRSSSGDAVVRDAGGSINLQATSGSVQAYGVSGDAQIELASGDFRLEQCRGDVVTRTASGDGVLREVSGSVRAIAASGSIDMDIEPRGMNEYIVHTASGDVRVVFDVSSDYGFLLDINTGSGSIEGDLDIQLEKVSRRTLRGVVGKGQGRLSIETASGNVTIHQAVGANR